MKTAMILAAGRGERLRPRTDLIPKAMCLVQGKPLIEYHVEHLAQAGFERLVINHAHLGGQIRAYLGSGKKWDLKISYAPEPPGGLETGGGIFNALPLLGSTPFLTVNADILTDYNFASLRLDEPLIAKLVLIKNPAHNPQGDFGFIDQQLSNENRAYTFAGIACYKPEVFHHCKMGRYSVTPLLRQLASQQRAGAELYQGIWIDIGTEERLQEVNNGTIL